MVHQKRFSPACERNKDVILEKLKLYTQAPGNLLEIGSGSGQHAAFFSSHLPHINWYPSDQPMYLESIQAYQQDTPNKNFKSPITFKVGHDNFPIIDFSYVFTANTFHIMSQQEVINSLSLLGLHLKSQSYVFVYGPFKKNKEFTSVSNKEFHRSLQVNNPNSGIKDFELIHKHMLEHSFNLVKDHDMPANNQFLVYLKH